MLQGYIDKEAHALQKPIAVAGTELDRLPSIKITPGCLVTTLASRGQHFPVPRQVHRRRIQLRPLLSRSFSAPRSPGSSVTRAGVSVRFVQAHKKTVREAPRPMVAMPPLG